jgi:UDP-glucuronate 4-epimerase
VNILLTGSAGFIGFHLTLRLLAEGHVVTGVDALTPYYDPALKTARLARLTTHNGYQHRQILLEETDALRRVAVEARPDIIIHLAAQPGVRYGLENPRAYVDSNLLGSFSVLDVAKDVKPQHLLLASTSSVYGANTKVPFEEGDTTLGPLSLYAATKIGMEAMAHAHAHLHGLATTAFRFFTVYGPWGRPDMAIFKFTKSIIAGEPIDVYGHGQMRRDFTYVDDLVEAVMRLMPLPPTGLPPYRVVNIGGGQPQELMDFIATLEDVIGKKAVLNFLPVQPGDVPQTYASPAVLQSLTGYRPQTTLAEGVAAFVAWYRGHYGV